MFRFVILTACIASPVAAEDWNLKAGETPLTEGELHSQVSGQTLVFYDDGQSKFSVGGAYSYTYANGGGTAFGQYEAHQDGSICIAFRNGASRCDLYVFKGGRLVLITEKGERFPVRPLENKS